jgi:hypothetical protein
MDALWMEKDELLTTVRNPGQGSGLPWSGPGLHLYFGAMSLR